MKLPPAPSLAASNDWRHTIEQYGKRCAKEALEIAAKECTNWANVTDDMAAYLRKLKEKI